MSAVLDRLAADEAEAVDADAADTAEAADAGHRTTRTTAPAEPLDAPEVMRLLGRVERGDQGAFETLYRAFSRRVYAYVLRRLGDPARAEEVVADTLYEVWRTPQRFRGDARFSTWLIGIARHKVQMSWRSRRPDETHDDIGDFAELIAGDDHGGFDVLADAQRSDGVRQCIGRLTSEHRECIHLVFYEGLSCADAARLVACPEGTVKTRLFHARKKLEHCLRAMLAREGVAGALA